MQRKQRHWSAVQLLHSRSVALFSPMQIVCFLMWWPKCNPRKLTYICVLKSPVGSCGAMSNILSAASVYLEEIAKGKMIYILNMKKRTLHEWSFQIK